MSQSLESIDPQQTEHIRCNCSESHESVLHL